ncbi:hypothetical protein LQ564_23510 [Massilia sp. G4R7]|uniref:Thioredoxin domain-containing protein n=1 Tax=Massilia phyllostachyos TaxID=2898585 RepID=A0ABS8QCL5_9BURK|nr:hypothetical protein [Massilia phyllostachyos]MCD2519273.1 hypothetical protein [Massilia phyllostachyos]
MTGQRLRTAIVVSLVCWMLSTHAAQPASPIVRSAAQLEEVLASSQPNPLDAFTPYGRQRFLESLKWGERGLTTFSYVSLVRELEPSQIAAVLALIDAGEYLPSVVAQLSGPPLRLPAPTSDARTRLAQIERLRAQESERRNDPDSAMTTEDEARMERRFIALFGEHVPQGALRALALGDLAPYFDAALIAAEGSADSLASRRLLAVYDEMRARGIDTRRGFDATVLRRLIAARQFEQARAFAAAKPHLAGEVVPAVRDPLGAGFTGRSVYRYDAAANVLVREALPPPPGTELVMVVDAGCGFSAAALAALREDAGLRTRLQQAGLVLVTPPRSPFTAGFVGEWNASNPALPIRVPYDTREWSAVDVINVPRFFLLRDGKIVGQVWGWPREGNKAALLALLDRAAD